MDLTKVENTPHWISNQTNAGAAAKVGGLHGKPVSTGTIARIHIRFVPLKASLRAWAISGLIGIGTSAGEKFL